MYRIVEMETNLTKVEGIFPTPEWYVQWTDLVLQRVLLRERRGGRRASGIDGTACSRREDSGPGNLKMETATCG
jgi:hypothetical protein